MVCWKLWITMDLGHFLSRQIWPSPSLQSPFRVCMWVCVHSSQHSPNWFSLIDLLFPMWLKSAVGYIQFFFFFYFWTVEVWSRIIFAIHCQFCPFTTKTSWRTSRHWMGLLQQLICSHNGCTSWWWWTGDPAPPSQWWTLVPVSLSCWISLETNWFLFSVINGDHNIWNVAVLFNRWCFGFFYYLFWLFPCFSSWSWM